MVATSGDRGTIVQEKGAGRLGGNEDECGSKKVGMHDAHYETMDSTIHGVWHNDIALLVLPGPDREGPQQAGYLDEHALVGNMAAHADPGQGGA